jgi:hypothetical protein
MVDEAGVTRLVERVVEARSDGLEVIEGTVEGVPDTSRYILVRVGGATRPVRAWRGAMATTPETGDRVSLLRGPEGYLVVDKVLDRDPEVTEIPEVPEGLDLADLVLLGVVPQTEMDRHIVEDGHLVTWNSQNTMAVDDNEWALMATGSISQRYGEVVFEARIGGGGSNGTTWTRGHIRGRIRQQADWATDPTVTIELLEAGDLTAADISLVVTSNAGPSTFELYIRVTREYEWATWTVDTSTTWVRADYAEWEWTGCGDFAPSLPAGTAYTATEVAPLVVGPATVAAGIATFAAIAAGATASITIDFTTAGWADQPDTNYAVSITQRQSTPRAIFFGVAGQSTTAFTLYAYNFDSVSRTPSVDYIVVRTD